MPNQDRILTSDKAELRTHFKALRAAIPADERAAIDAAITAKVLVSKDYQEADLILPYLSFGAEVETRGLIEAAWENGKTVALPRCVPNTRNMKWYRVTSFNGLIKSSLGVEEPAENPSNEIDPATFANPLVLVPGLTFDRQGYRLGYGGGYYDTFLESFRGVSIGLCRVFQLSEEVSARDPHDLPVNFVVTEDSSY